VRQFGNLSYSRIFDAGHLVPLHQPETAFTVFTRVIRGVDISMGRTVDLSTFSTHGLSDSTVHKNQVPKEEEKSICWIRDVEGTCTGEERKAIALGEGVVNHGVWTLESDVGVENVPVEKPSKSMEKSGVTEGAMSTVPLTGVYVATGTPAITTAKAKSDTVRVKSWGWGWGVAVLWLLA
jgi:hypothetical protein